MSDTYLPEAQNTAWQTSDTVDLRKTAILVIDILGGNKGILPTIKAEADRAVEIVKAARAKDIPVIFANDAHIEGLDQEIELWGAHGLAGTEEAQPYSEFDVQATDYVIPKRRYDAFFQTDLYLTLRELGVDTLIAMGFDTNICVLQTLASAYFLGFKTIVPGDACASFLVGTHEAGLEYFSRCYDSRVVPSSKVLEYLA